MVFSGTAATYGHGTAVVTATGMRTEMGRIAGLLKETHDEATPLQRELDRTGKLLGIVVVVIAIVMIATIIIVEDVRGLSAIFDVLILGVALAVAAVPEGLPAVVTAVLSIGVQRMARRQRDRAAPGRGRDARFGQRDRLRQDRHADEERDDRAGRRDRERARHVRGLRIRADGRGAAGRRRTDRRRCSESSSSARSRPPIERTTRPCRNATAGGRCRATRPKARCSSPLARPASDPRRSTSGCPASARCRSPPSAS